MRRWMIICKYFFFRERDICVVGPVAEFFLLSPFSFFLSHAEHFYWFFPHWDKKKKTPNGKTLIPYMNWVRRENLEMLATSLWSVFFIFREFLFFFFFMVNFELKISFSTLICKNKDLPKKNILRNWNTKNSSIFSLPDVKFT